VQPGDWVTLRLECEPGPWCGTVRSLEEDGRVWVDFEGGCLLLLSPKMLCPVLGSGAKALEGVGARA
jgi:hypothetical protein